LRNGRRFSGSGAVFERYPRQQKEDHAAGLTSSVYKRITKSMVRASWDHYFMNIAREVATRATCDRKHVGAVITREKTILATGYNGSVRGLPHCDDVGHMMEDGHCVRTVHAESNAIAQAARMGGLGTVSALDGVFEGVINARCATIYVTASPCWPCFKLIANAGIKRIVFGEFYRDERIFSASKQLEIELVDLKPPSTMKIVSKTTIGIAREWLLDTYPSAWESDHVRSLAILIEAAQERGAGLERARVVAKLEKEAVDWPSSDAGCKALQVFARDLEREGE
jgi:dCMP deaminase